MVDGVRDAFTGHYGGGPLALGAAVAAALAALALGLGTQVFRKANA
ncbi:hypothetical protein ACF06W_25805 [Streptomyces albus]